MHRCRALFPFDVYPALDCMTVVIYWHVRRKGYSSLVTSDKFYFPDRLVLIRIESQIGKAQTDELLFIGYYVKVVNVSVHTISNL